MSRRRSRKGRGALALVLAGWAVILAAALAITVWHVLGWLAATAIIAGGAYLLGRRHARPAPAPSPAARRPLRAGEASRGTRRPPVHSVTVSALCAGQEHEWCEDAACGCTCGHPGIRRRQPQTTAPIPAGGDDLPPF